MPTETCDFDQLDRVAEATAQLQGSVEKDAIRRLLLLSDSSPQKKTKRRSAASQQSSGADGPTPGAGVERSGPARQRRLRRSKSSVASALGTCEVAVPPGTQPEQRVGGGFQRNRDFDALLKHSASLSKQLKQVTAERDGLVSAAHGVACSSQLAVGLAHKPLLA